MRHRSSIRAAASVLLSVALPTTLWAQHPPKAVAHAPAGAPEATAEADHAPTCHASTILSARGSVFPVGAKADTASFVDITVQRVHPELVRIGCRSFVAPFVSIDPQGAAIAIGHASNLQDNVTISGKVTIGDRVSVAHGATIIGPATIGAPDGLPAFVGFNSMVAGAVVEPDAMVTHLVKVSPGITIHAGTKVLPGKWVRTQEEADNEALGKVTKVTDADREFMHGVLHVNNSFAAGYAALSREAPIEMQGAGRDPGHSDFNHDSDEPSFAGRALPHPTMHLRVIGGVSIMDPWDELDKLAGRSVSLRADEGEHFHFGSHDHFADHVTFHALEHSNIDVGSDVMIGFHVVVHGGSDDSSEQKDLTHIGDRAMVGSYAVVFRSKVGDGVQIGERAYVDGCHLAPGTVVPARTIMVKDKVLGVVEW
jgi:carbonic anhydrase/acetyltransferase-like protein (isoleucine patch superfamily)